MSAAHELARAPRAPAARAPGALARRAPALAVRRLGTRLRDLWLPRAAWTVGRTGRAGLAGIALLLGAALFLASTHREVAAEVEALRAELAAARQRARAGVDEVVRPAPAARALPGRAEMPAILRQLFNRATQARLALESGRYEIGSTRSGGVVRYHVTFPVTGPYPQIRAFLDGTLATMPAVALGDLVLERKSIADPEVAAEIRMTVFTDATAAPAQEASPRAAARPARARTEPREADAPASDRVVAPTHAAALFAQRSWVVLKPAPVPPPPPPPAPPPEPTAPPLPYTFVGSFTPQGEPPVYFLARGDRVIDVRVGDRLDGVYQLESAAGGQLVFVYLPLEVRQTLAAGAPK